MKCKKIVPLILSCCILTGCWDKIEIDRKAFVSTIAVDIGENIRDEEKFKEVKPNEPIKSEEFKKLNISFGFPDISELGPQKSGTAKEQFIKVKAFSMQDALTELAAKTSRSVHTGHVQLLMLSDEVLEYPETVKEFLDYFDRQPKVNRTMDVVVAKGKAENYTKGKPVLEKNIEAYITGVMNDSSKNSSILPIKLNEVLMKLYGGGTCTIPTIEFSKEKPDEIVFSGLSIIKDYKMVRPLSPSEMGSLYILKGTIKGGKETIFRDGHPLEFEIRELKRKLKLTDDKNLNKLKFKIDIDIEGQINSYYMEKDIFTEKELKEIQDNLNDVIEKKCEKLARMSQEEYSTDIIGLKDYLEKFKPDIYKKVKDNWNQVYKNAEVDVNVNTKARRIGVTK
ncbi:MAG: Ger(x)C family spore germination protein [Clostridium sp.]|nr:Ger(x)C family spore germination protein [Clostridium sp.]